MLDSLWSAEKGKGRLERPAVFGGCGGTTASEEPGDRRPSLAAGDTGAVDVGPSAAACEDDVCGEGGIAEATGKQPPSEAAAAVTTGVAR